MDWNAQRRPQQSISGWMNELSPDFLLTFIYRRVFKGCRMSHSQVTAALDFNSSSTDFAKDEYLNLVFNGYPAKSKSIKLESILNEIKF